MADPAQQEKVLHQQVQQKPSADSWQRLGLIRHLQNHFSAAIPAFREALTLDPSLWTSHLFLGIDLYRTNQFKAALEALQHADQLAPVVHAGRDEVDYWLGATNVALQQPWIGLQSLEKLLARNPKHAAALELATQTYTDLGSKFWNDVAERDFETSEGREVFGHMLEDEGNAAKAMETYRVSQVMNPKRPGPRLAMARMLLKENKSTEALPLLKEELTLSTDPEVLLLAGLAAAQIGDGVAAERWLKEAERWESTKTDAATALAALKR